MIQDQMIDRLLYGMHCLEDLFMSKSDHFFNTLCQGLFIFFKQDATLGRTILAWLTHLLKLYLIDPYQSLMRESHPESELSQIFKMIRVKGLEEHMLRSISEKQLMLSLFNYFE